VQIPDGLGDLELELILVGRIESSQTVLHWFKYHFEIWSMTAVTGSLNRQLISNSLTH